MKPFESFKFNKAFGQNFISDKNLLNAIAKDSGISFNDNVLEIGTGAGTLTEVLASHAKKVVTFEIDKKLTEYLTEKFASIDNVQLVLKDALATPINEIEDLFSGQDFHLVANLPYYITTPLIFKFLEETTKVKSITVMVQKEAAQRLCAPVGSRLSGAVTVAVDYYAKAEKLDATVVVVNKEEYKRGYIADKYGLVFVPLQERFDKVNADAPDGYWLRDGVHPTAAGHRLISDAWLEVFHKEIVS